MKLIFLDIDGVVATRKSYLNHRLLEDIKWGVSAVPFDKVSVDNLNRITDATGAKIVVSSSWRALHKFDELKAILASEGITGEVIGKTPDTNFAHSRAKEIILWLKEHATEVESFVVLDDEIRDIQQTFPKNFVQTSMQMGLIPRLADETIKILNMSVQ